MAIQSTTATPTTAQALQEQQEQNEAAQQQRVKKTADTTRTTGTAIGIIGEIGGAIVGAYNPAAGEAVKKIGKYGEQAASVAASSYEAANAEDGQEVAAWSSVATETLTAAYGASQEGSASSNETPLPTQPLITAEGAGEKRVFKNAAQSDAHYGTAKKAAQKEHRVKELKKNNPSILSSDGTIDTSTAKGKQAYRAAARAEELRTKQKDIESNMIVLGSESDAG